MSMKSPDSDHLFVKRAQGGDYEAFDELVRRHEQRLYALSMRMLRHREDAENVVQTTFLNILEHLEGFRGESTFATWSTRIATHVALNVLRKRKGLPTISLDDRDDEAGEVHHPRLISKWPDDPARVVETKELNRILRETMLSLPEKLRLVFVLRDVEELSVAETAEVLQISEANVKVRLLRARLALREKLTRAFGDIVEPVAGSHGHEGEEQGSTTARRLIEVYDRELKNSS